MGMYSLVRKSYVIDTVTLDEIKFLWKPFTLQGIIWVLPSAQGQGKISPVHGFFYSTWMEF